MGEKSIGAVWAFGNRDFWTLALVAAAIPVLGMVFSPAVVHLFAGKNIAGAQAVDLNRIIFPYLFFVSLARSEEHTSELQSHLNLVCRLLLEKKKNNI